MRFLAATAAAAGVLLAQTTSAATFDVEFKQHLSHLGLHLHAPSTYDSNAAAAAAAGDASQVARAADEAANDDPDVKNYRFLNAKTRKFVVNGKKLPEVKFDIGESYAGLMPISSDPKEERKLFFWFFPAQDPKHGTKDITLWLNGGPGCSSLAGLLTENGPFLWQDGEAAPYPNPYSWNKLTNMIWVEQPVGTGFSQGKPSIKDEHDLADQFAGFWKNFITTFGFENADMYLTGESYAGRYVPYIAKNFLDQKDSQHYNLKGISINNPTIGDALIQFAVPMAPFFSKWQDLINMDEGVLARLNQWHHDHAYDAYLDKYMRFPPPQESFPEPMGVSDNDTIFDDVNNAVNDANPCFNPYMIAQQCPTPLSAQGGLDGKALGVPKYFARSDVQRHIHAPHIDWSACAAIDVFPTGDHSKSPLQDADRTLVSVIEATKNTMVGSGNLDTVLYTNGTVLALQNATWGGSRGFNEYLPNRFFIPKHDIDSNITVSKQVGNVGKWMKRDGLTYYEVQLSGHQLPGMAQSGGYRMLQVLLGKVSDLSSKEPVF